MGGFDYLQVHLYYTIPPALLLSIIYHPLWSPLDRYKICFLIAIAVISTTPWDSYLIHSNIWTYPREAVLGLTLFKIPAEEYFFFLVQTYNTCLLYLLLNKPTFFPAYLKAETGPSSVKDQLKLYRSLGQVFLVSAFALGIHLLNRGQKGTYLGLILVWAVPFLLLLWTLAYQFLLGLPVSKVFLPIVLPTMYLWIVDTIALRRGTWVIQPQTKLELELWDGLEVEEALFFLITNMLVVFGLVAFDNATSILYAFPNAFPNSSPMPSPYVIINALLLPTSAYDSSRLLGYQAALERLQSKSRSFSLASGMFQGRIRIDLVLIYAFCRVADDLVDNATSPVETQQWIDKLQHYLDCKYSETANDRETATFIANNFPPSAHSILTLLPTSYLPSNSLYSLISGFRTDTLFPPARTSDDHSNGPCPPFPIATEHDLYAYASNVAGTVGEMVLSTVYHHLSLSSPTCPPSKCASQTDRIIHAGFRMGVALQYINIARDIGTDAREGRVYIPTAWLAALDPPLTPQAVIGAKGDLPDIPALRRRLLDRAFAIYEEARDAIEELPAEVRGPIRVAVEGYMEIGRVMREGRFVEDAGRKGRASVPGWRRVWVGWTALRGPRR